VYFSEYVKYPTAEFQKDIFVLTEDESTQLGVLVAFRGSGKSTIMTMSYPIWAILGKQRKKFVIIVGQTTQQAKLHLTNLKRELESNELLRGDLGPFEEREEEWSSGSLVIPQYNARITALSTEQSIRGLRHGAYRPDLIICDDVEDLGSVRNRESRDQKYQWLMGDVIPSGDLSTRTFVVGNLLHEDSLIMRLKQDIDEERLAGIFKAYPLVRDDDEIMWPGKYCKMEDIAKLKKQIGDEISWSREYLLRIVSDAGRVVHPEWLHYYDEINEPSDELICTAIGIDLAISEKETADYTAMVAAKVYGRLDELRIYILPFPINKRMSYPEQVETLKSFVDGLGGRNHVDLFIEEVGYQSALIQDMKKLNYDAKGAKTHGQDKRARIAMTTHMIQQGVIRFPKKGCENLIMQLTGFGVEKHDDLADAFAILANKIKEQDVPPPRITVLGGDNDERGWRPLSLSGLSQRGLSGW
jgi:predicted phage terminase large subunit-like protein